LNIEGLAASLLSASPTEFTSRRNARAKELRASGQIELAKQLSDLKKPSLPLWSANQIARRDRPVLDQLRQAGQAVTRVQAAAAAGRTNAARELRSASEEYQRRIEAAGKVAAAVLAETGRPAGEETIRRIHEILRLAALQGGDSWRRLQAGALTSEPRGSDDVLEMFGAGGGPAGGKRAEQAEARRATELARKAARASAEEAQRADAAAARRRQEAKEMAAAAKRAADRAKEAEAEAARARQRAKQSAGTALRKPRRD
jgi:hypothetical protein